MGEGTSLETSSLSPASNCLPLLSTSLPSTNKCLLAFPPAGYQYVGVEFARGLCGVSIIRSGEAMEAALRECCQGIKLGKILIHRWA